MKLSIVIPAYNEELNIKQTILELKETLTTVNYVNNYEIIVIDDHSSDKTFEIIKSFRETNIKGIRLSKRSGSHISIRAGLAASAGDAVLCISADRQEDVKVINKMIEKWSSGNKIIWALRNNRKSETWYIHKAAQIFYRILLWLGDTEHRNIDFSRADFFLLDKKVVKAINNCFEKNTSLFGLIVWLGFNQDFVEYNRRKRRLGKSKWRFRSRLHLAKDWIIAFSGVPLKLISIIGFFTAVLGFLYGIYVIINAIVGTPRPGWSSIMVAIFVLGGIQMIMLGIIGEYLWRNLDESRRRPLYLIESTTTTNNESPIKNQ